MSERKAGFFLEELKEVVIQFLKDEDLKVILFGSRARKDHHAGSDVDIGLIPHSVLDQRISTLLKENIENLNIPYKVEIVDFSKTSLSFQKEALKEAVIWKDYA